MTFADVDSTQFSPPAQKALAADAPPQLRNMAARGVLPGAKPAEILIVVACFAGSADEALAATARTALGKLPAPILAGALNADLPGSVLDAIAHHRELDPEQLSAILRMSRLRADTLEYLARNADEARGEVIATNEQLMLAHPIVIEKLYMNKAVRMSTADRLIELAVRNGLELSIPAFKEAAAAIQDQLIPEPSEEPTFDDILFSEVAAVAAEIDLGLDEDTHEVDEEGEERVKEKVLPLHAKIAQMTITQKIRGAQLGTAAERFILIRDPNKLVSSAAAKSPMMRENEAIQVSAARSVSEDVLRIIAMNPEFVRQYQVKLNLVSNPRTPLTFAARMVPYLRDNDLRALSKSKNVSGAIAQAVKQQLAKKERK